MKKATLNGSLVIEHMYIIYTIRQVRDGNFFVEAVKKSGGVYLMETLNTFDSALEWIRKTEREY